MRNDDLDLIRLFGLSPEEAAGLGLDAAHLQSGPNASCDEGRHPAGTAPRELPAHAHPVGEADGAAIDERMEARPTTTPPPPPPSHRISAADELELFALLDRAPSATPADYNGYEAARGLSLVDSTASSAPEARDMAEQRRDPETSGRRPEVAPHAAADADDDDVNGRFVVPDAAEESGQSDDLISLFGLSSEEALGLGLPAPTGASGNAPTLGDNAPPAPDVDDGWEDSEASGAPASGPTLPTMPLRATGGAVPAIPERDAQLGSWDVCGGDPELSAPVSTTAIESIGGAALHERAAMVYGAADDVAPALRDAYAEESAELLDSLHLELERLESDPDDHGALLETRRLIHTLKGGAKMCGFEQVVTLTHSCENLLDLIADGVAALDGAALRALFECAPLLQTIVDDAIAGNGTDVDSVTRLSAHFDALCDAPSAASGAVDDNSDPVMADDYADPAADDHADPAVAGEYAECAAEVYAATDEAAAIDDPLIEAEDLPGIAARVVDVKPVDDGAIHLARDHGGLDSGAHGIDSLAASEQAAATGSEAPVPAEPRLSPTMQTSMSVFGRDDAAPTGSQPEPLARAWSPGARTPAEAVDARQEASARPPARRGANSINVDLAKVDAVVAKVTEMAAHRVSAQGMLGRLLEATEDARRNVTRLRTLVMQLGNECTGMQPAETDGLDDLNLETYNAVNTLVLQLQEAVLDQQALVQGMHDTITSHWSLQATESRADADIQSALMSIRLVPIANMRVRLDGVVRQAAEATGKQVRWQLQGGSVAVEKNVFDRLFEPLMHLLRNAVDHGIEPPAARRGAGKPESGAITVSAAQEGNQIVITVGDDGAGIVPNKVASLAVERGLITAEQANAMGYQQKIGLIFMPGLSTAGAVSHISGRGVGMDAVREACLRMGGSIDVSSQAGLGTTFTLRLPLSLSVTRGLIIRDGGCLMVLPVAQVIALHLVPASDVVETARGRVARIEGQELPIYNLPALPGSGPSSYVQNGEVNVLQVAHDGGSIGLLIEDVLGEEEVLIKAPPALLRGVKSLLGAYVLPDGKVAPVVNLPQLLVDLRPVATLSAAREDGKAQEITALVVDDSMSMRVALSGTLQSAGFKVLTARDGQEALDILKREGLPSLVTLDVEMPRMDGLETLFAIRQMSGAQELPVFMMTSRGGAKHRRAAEQLGATRYFTKPYRDSELATAARSVVGAGRNETA